MKTLKQLTFLVVVAASFTGCATATPRFAQLDTGALTAEDAYEDCLNEVETRADFEACGEILVDERAY